MYVSVYFYMRSCSPKKYRFDENSNSPSENTHSKWVGLFETVAFVFVSFFIHLFRFARLFSSHSLSLPLSQSLRVCACCILVYSCADMKRIQEKRNGGKSISTLRALFLCCQVCQDYFVLWIHVQYGIHRCVYGSENIGEMYESMGSTVYCVHVSLFSFVDGMQ